MSSRGRFQVFLILSAMLPLAGGVPVAFADHDGICKDLPKSETKCDDLVDPEKIKDDDKEKERQKREKAEAAKAACERMKRSESEAADRRKKTCGKIAGDRQNLDSCASLTKQSEYEKCSADAYAALARDTGKLAEDDDASLKEIGDARKEMDASAEGVGREDTLAALDKESGATTDDLGKMSTAAKGDSDGYGSNSLEAEQRATNLASEADPTGVNEPLAGSASAPASPSAPAPVATEAYPGGSAAPANNLSAGPPSQSVQQASDATSPTDPVLPALRQSFPAGLTTIDAEAAQVISGPGLAVAARSAPHVSPTSASVASAAVDQASRALSSQSGGADRSAANRLAPTAPSGEFAASFSGGGVGAGLDRMRAQIQRGLASSSASSEGPALGSRAEETALARAGIAPADARPNEATGGWESGASSGGSPAQAEALSPFGKPLGDPKISLMGSDTDKEIKRMLLENEPGGGENSSLAVDADDGIGEKNGPSLFQRAHVMHEVSVRKGRLRGIAIR